MMTSTLNGETDVELGQPSSQRSGQPSYSQSYQQSHPRYILREESYDPIFQEERQRPIDCCDTKVCLGITIGHLVVILVLLIRLYIHILHPGPV